MNYSNLVTRRSVGLALVPNMLFIRINPTFHFYSHLNETGGK